MSKGNDYKYDQDMELYYSESQNKYITQDEYLKFGKLPCGCCGAELYEDEVCWG